MSEQSCLQQVASVVDFNKLNAFWVSKSYKIRIPLLQRQLTLYKSYPPPACARASSAVVSRHLSVSYVVDFGRKFQ